MYMSMTKKQDCFTFRDKTFSGKVRLRSAIKSEVTQEEEYKDALETRLITSIRNSKYELIIPLPIEIECTNREYVAKFSPVDIFSVGSTPDEVVEDFGILFVDYFESLLKKEKTLAINLKGELEIIKKYLSKINPE